MMANSAPTKKPLPSNRKMVSTRAKPSFTAAPR
jgi:hypothetical protein